MAKYTPRPELRHCFQSAAAAAGWDMDSKDGSDAKLYDAFNSVRGRMAGYVRQGMSPKDAAMRAGKEVAQEQRAANALARLNAKRNLARRIALFRRVTSRAEDLGGKDRIYQALLPEITATVRTSDTGGNRLSTEAMGNANVRRRLATIEHDLRAAKLLKVARSGAIDKDIGREMYEHSLADSGEPARIGYTGNQQAAQIAAIFRKHLVDSRSQLNNLGAWIGNYAGYVLRSNWDPGRMLAGDGKAARDAWVADAMQHLDPRTFDGVDDPKAFLEHTFNDIASGVHENDSSGVEAGFKDPAFTGPANVAKRLSQSRVLHWKDADAWQTMMDKYGKPGTLMERLYNTLDRQSRQQALIDRWGTSPRAEFEATVRRLKAHYAQKDPALVRQFDEHQPTLDRMFGNLDGANSAPATSAIAKFGAYSRAIESMAKLGGVLFTHFNAFGTGASALAYHGVPYLRAYAEGFGNLLRAARNEDEYRQIVDTVGAGIEGAHGAAMAPGWMGDDLPGTLSKISHHYFQLTGLSPMLRAVKDGVAFTMSRTLALAKDKEWGALSPEIRNSLNSFGFSPEDWDAVRAAPNNPTYHGREHLTPDAALRSPADLSDAQRQQLTNKLAAYYSSIADEYTITPTMLDKRYFNSIGPNTLQGQILRFVGQFKQWPAAAMRQGIGRELVGRKQIGGRFGGLAHLILATTALGYLRNVLTDLSEGKVPPEPDAKTFVASLAQGGGLGIMGDFLFGQDNRFGQSMADTLAGPVLGEGAGDIMQIWNNTRDAAATGDETKLHDIPSEMVKMAARNTPFANLFYVRGALNYLLLDSLQEALNPGYLERAQAAAQRNEGISYMAPSTPILGMFNPQSHLHTFGQ